MQELINLKVFTVKISVNVSIIALHDFMVYVYEKNNETMEL